MNKYNGLLSEAAQQYHIDKGIQETEYDWKVRLIYSICGLMAYASLWDDVGEEAVSIVHLKRKVRSMLASYKLLYPEISGRLPGVSEELEDEIAKQFLNAGVVYHCPNRITASMKREEQFSGVLFQRGIALDRIACVSGLGFYAKQGGTASPDGLKAMFGLERENLQTLWDTTVSSAVWQSNPLVEQNIEYLRLKPPFSQGYWVNKPDTAETISILRSGMEGEQLYYLYRCSGGVLRVSPLPRWRVESYNYRALACACLSDCGTLPPIEYRKDGALVHMRLNYLLPPRELEFLKLYSWPETCTSLPCNFKRKLSTEVFAAIKNVLSDAGYTFKERLTIGSQ